jgi:site-specific DNA-cytosine methylase
MTEEDNWPWPDGMRWASIVPLIGGETIAMEKVFEKKPAYMMTYNGFEGNDQHIVEHYNNQQPDPEKPGYVPYYILENKHKNGFIWHGQQQGEGPEGEKNGRYVDVVNTICPCAGLSSLNVAPSGEAEVNDYMAKTAKYVLENIGPKVLWGENAPRLATKLGEPVVKKLRAIAKENGYTFSLYKTKSLLHGLSQVRDRSFYFFWKGDAVPMFDWYDRPNEKIEDTIRNVKRDPADPMSALANTKTPSKDDLYYRYVLEVLHNGMKHSDFVKTIKKSCNIQDYIEKHSDYRQLAKWLEGLGETKAKDKAIRNAEKLESGGNIMRRTSEIPADYIGAFVGHMPLSLTHPDEDRYLTYRECMEIMKLPSDFNIINPKKNLNHLCQNVPVTTAMDMAYNIRRFLFGRSEMIYDDFVVQCNKSHSIKTTPNTLDKFL